MAVALVILASVLAGPGHDRNGDTSVSSGEAAVAGDVQTVTTGVPGGGATVVPAAPAPAEEPPAPTTPPEVPVSRATTSPTTASPPAPACRNSSDPGCGPFAWQPAPGANQPLTITMDVTTAAPTAGEALTVHVVASDPDAEVTTNGATWFFADPHSTEAQVGLPLTMSRGVGRHGAWTPPAPRPGRLEMSFTHTFSRPGTYEFTFTALSGDEAEPGNAERHPYASRSSASLAVTVRAP